MADMKMQMERLKGRILAQNGTVLDSVEGVVELDDADAQGNPRLGPVLVLRSIEEGAQLKLAHPRPVTVLGTLSGQVFGAYRVKAGNLLSVGSSPRRWPTATCPVSWGMPPTT